MQIVNIARRAKLGHKTKQGYKQAIDKLSVAKKYNKKVTESLSKDDKFVSFHASNYLNGLLSILEAYISDTLLEYIVCNPGHSNSKTIQFSDVIKSGSIAEVATFAAEKRVNELAYKKFIEYHDAFSSTIGLEDEVDKVVLDKLAEIKASRDIFVHANGKCNQIYIQKSGSLARANVGDNLSLPSDYIVACEETIEEYLSSVFDQIPDRIKNYGRLNAFREMWESCELSAVRKFDEVWISEPTLDMARPSDAAFEYGWSGSEKAAFDFFLGIYSQDHPKRDKDLMYAMSKWPPSSDVGKIIISWMESPFWF